jgi:hypothetical protein
VTNSAFTRGQSGRQPGDVYESWRPHRVGMERGRVWVVNIMWMPLGQREKEHGRMSATKDHGSGGLSIIILLAVVSNRRHFYS